MRISSTHCIAFAALLFCGGYASAQTKEQKAELSREMLREALKEKWHPGKAMTHNPHLPAALKTTGDDQRITTTGTGTDEAEISIIVNPSDSSKLVLSYMEETANGLKFPIYYSSNAGQTWTKSSFNAQTPAATDFPGQVIAGGGDPTFAWDKDGRLYFSWIYLTVKQTLDTGFFSVYWAHSDDNGHSWALEPGADHFIGQGAVNPLTQGLIVYKDGVCDRQWLSIDNTGGPHQGTLYCSFVNFPDDVSSFNAVRAKPAGASSFGNITSIYNGISQLNNVEVGNNGDVHVTFVDAFNNEVRHAVSSNAGASFGSTTLIATGSSLFGGLNIIHNRENAATNLAIDGAGNLHVVWSSFPTGSVESFYSRSTDNGVNWSAPLALGSFFSGNRTFMPTISAHDNNVAISLTAIDNNDSARYYQLNSTDNGVSFTAAPRLLSSAPTYYPGYASDPNVFFGDYNRSVRTSCNVFATWSDGRNNTGPKVYFSRSGYCATGVEEITAVNNGIQLQSMYPNPARGHVTLSLTSSKAEKATIDVYDAAGKVVLKLEKQLAAGNQDISLDVSRLSGGNYVLSIRDKGSVIVTRNLMVQ